MIETFDTLLLVAVAFFVPLVCAFHHAASLPHKAAELNYIEQRGLIKTSSRGGQSWEGAFCSALERGQHSFPFFRTTSLATACCAAANAVFPFLLPPVLSFTRPEPLCSLACSTMHTLFLTHLVRAQRSSCSASQKEEEEKDLRPRPSFRLAP
eukprot:2072309-Rhodomonas_salina.3